VSYSTGWLSQEVAESRKLPEEVAWVSESGWVTTPTQMTGWSAADEWEPASITEDREAYRIRITLGAIDSRRLYVFAAARSVSIEIRMKCKVRHEGLQPKVTETIANRRLREIEFPVEIDPAATLAEVSDAYLEIVARKACEGESDSHARIVNFERRKRQNPSATA
jgi:HSP20 family molecular chaperone IbpA